MGISAISDLTGLQSIQLQNAVKNTNNGAAFDALLDSAVSMIRETNDYTNKAEEEEMRYAMGLSDGIQDLQVAQQKANISLQYTVAVRNAFMDGYKEIMNLSI